MLLNTLKKLYDELEDAAEKGEGAGAFDMVKNFVNLYSLGYYWKEIKRQLEEE